MYDAFDRRGMLHDLYATDNGGGGGNIPTVWSAVNKPEDK